MNPDDTMARVEFNNAYKNISMKKNDNPTNLFEQISAVQQENGVDVYQDGETALVLEKAPEKYESVLVGEIRVTGTHFKIDDFEDAMIQMYILSLKIIIKKQK